MTLEERFQLCRSVGEECVQDDELRNLLDKKPVPAWGIPMHTSVFFPAQLELVHPSIFDVSHIK